MGERNIARWPPVRPSTGDPTCTLGVCPGWDLNLQPFGARDAPTNGATLARTSGNLYQEGAWIL